MASFWAWLQTRCTVERREEDLIFNLFLIYPGAAIGDHLQKTL
jgi:hypothetical protein